MNYVDISYADTYFETRFNAKTWAPTSDPDKEALLTTATQIIDTLNYEGDKHDENQELEFPRGTDTTIPTPIKKACCEIAFALSQGYDNEYELRNLSNINIRFDQSSIRSDPTSIHDARVNGIPSVIAWDFLRPFLRDGSSITLSRTS